MRIICLNNARPIRSTVRPYAPSAARAYAAQLRAERITDTLTAIGLGVALILCGPAVYFALKLAH